MGCWTIYVVRELDASVWACGLKYGPVELAPAELEELLADKPERWAPTSIDRTWCRGVYLDRRARRVRVYSCWCTNYDPMALDQRMREHAGWADWDVGVAFEQDVDFNVLLDLPPRNDYPERLDGWVGFPEAGCLTRHPVRDRWVFEWDRATDTLVYESYFEHSIETVVTTIDADGRVHDYAFDDDVLFEALGRGPALLDDLATIAPVPGLWEARAGALIDLPQRTIWLWLHEPVAPALYDALRARWSGWRVEREPGQVTGHLERTGRTRDDPERPVVKLHDLPPRAFQYITAIAERPIEPPRIPADEAALLEAIHADLRSDDARLVYADLLLAKGDQRGKMIAVQCELARLEARDTPSARRYQLAELARDLERTYGRERFSCADELRYVRGFVAHAAVDRVENLVDGKVLDQIPTLESLRIRTLHADPVRRLADQPGLRRLRAFETRPEMNALWELVEVGVLEGIEMLAIVCEHPHITLDLAHVLAENRFAKLTELQLSGAGINGAGLAEILTPRGLQHLTALDLRALQALDVGRMDQVARCTTLARLERIAIWGRPYDEGTAVLAASPHLSRLRSWASDTHGHGVKILESLPGLRALTLHVHDQAETTVPALAACPRLAQLESLALTGIGPLGLAALAESRYLDGLAVLKIAQPYGDHEAALARVRERFGDRLAITSW